MSGSSGCGDCAQQNPDGDPGCSDPVCQDIVCVLDAFCCDVVWDGLCAEQALANCDCGSVFALSATIGQADAGVLSGGEFVLAGGFWGAGVAVVSCPWDCGDGDGLVGIVDFLELLAQWDIVGTSCDFDGGGVGIVDFLKLLAQWGPCD